MWEFNGVHAQAKKDGRVYHAAPEIKIVGHGLAMELLPDKTPQWLALLAAQEGN